MFYVTLNVNSVLQHVIQIKIAIMKHVNASVKIIVRVKRIIFGILAHVFVKMVSILKALLMIQ